MLVTRQTGDDSFNENNTIRLQRDPGAHVFLDVALVGHVVSDKTRR